MGVLGWVGLTRPPPLCLLRAPSPWLSPRPPSVAHAPTPGIDLLKFDGCGGKFEAVNAMRNALNATGRPVIYSVHSSVTPGTMASYLKSRDSGCNANPFVVFKVMCF